MNAERSRDFNRQIGIRIALARKEVKLTQEQLSDRLGFKDRQILSNIEAGKRRVNADELVTCMRLLGKTLEYFTDPLQLVGEGAFCWRAKAASAVLDTFEDKAKQWIAMFRTLGEELGEPMSPLVPQLAITPKSSFEDAWSAAERLVREWDLGEVPASRLPQVAEQMLKILVLYVDPPEEIWGAACHLQEFNTILIKRTDPDGRRNYDFAHELFHLLTWQVMPPERIDDARSPKPKVRRLEQLADNFAAALLMPQAVVLDRWGMRGDREIHDWLNKTAEELYVTAVALRFRLRNLGCLSQAEALEIMEDRLTWNGRIPTKRDIPKLYSGAFVDRIHKGIDRGLISVRRVAGLLDCTIEDLKELMESYGLPVPFDL